MLKFLLLFPLLLNAYVSEFDIYSKKFKHVEILDAKEYKTNSKISELSDLVYVDNTLYAVSDKGYLCSFKLDIKNQKINSIKLQQKHKLKDKHKKKLQKKFRDSEGLAYKDGHFLISFEDQNRVMLYTLNGKAIKKIKINKHLNSNANYHSSNSGLESVAYSKKYGVVTAPEEPLKDKKQKYHRIYAKNQVWKFKADGSITALEFRDKDRLLILLREFSIFRRVTTLKEIDLSSCRGVCKAKTLMKLDSKDGCRIDNFEGLTKIKDDTYLMVSDDNDSFWQKTLFVLFRIKD